MEMLNYETSWSKIFFSYMRFGLMAGLASIPFAVGVVVYHWPEYPTQWIAIGVGVTVGLIEERIYTGRWFI